MRRLHCNCNAGKNNIKSILFNTAAAVIAFLFTFPAMAQVIERSDMVIIPAPDIGNICTLDHTGVDAFYHREADDLDRAKRLAEQPLADFDVTYIADCNGQNWPQTARNAFEYALQIWSTHISSEVPIRIEATWRNLATNTLGSAGPTRVVSLSGAEPNTWYTIAQASAMTGQDIVSTIEGEEYDIVVNMNCDFGNWYFGTDANTPSNTIDFVSVVLHEIGHGIGFLGSMSGNTSNQTASWGIGQANYPLIYDRFVRDGDDNSVLNTSVYPNNSGALYEAVTGRRSGIFHWGTEGIITNAGPVRLYAPNPWNSGSSYSHVDQNTFTGTDNALMRPRIDQALAIHSPGPVFCSMMGDWGWPLGPNCQALVSSGSVIALSRELLEFGVSTVGQPRNESITITNEPDAEDVLRGFLLVNDDNFRVVSNNQINLEPGESTNITIQYLPVSDEVHDMTAQLFHNASNRNRPISIPLFGESLLSGEIARLEQNYPNPFNPTTLIPYVLPETSNVRLDVYTIDGRRVLTLVNEQQTEGRYEIPVNASNLASGVYMYRLVVDGFARTKKFMVIK
jgi:hypothetical protein